MDLPEGVVGILLAGGRSSRMGGGDKCLLPLVGQPLLAHVIERLRPQVSDIVINANGDLSRFAPFGLPLVPDRLGDHAGPLAGVHAGIEWALANRSRSRFVITAATDTPFFPSDLVSGFCTAINGAEPPTARRPVGRGRASRLRALAAFPCSRSRGCPETGIAKSRGLGKAA